MTVSEWPQLPQVSIIQPSASLGGLLYILQVLILLYAMHLAQVGIGKCY